MCWVGCAAAGPVQPAEGGTLLEWLAHILGYYPGSLLAQASLPQALFCSLNFSIGSGVDGCWTCPAAKQEFLLLPSAACKPRARPH